MVSTSDFGSGNPGREERRPGSQIKFQNKFHKIISFRIISKITVNRKIMVWLYPNSATDIFLANFWDFDKFIWMVVFKGFSICKTIYIVEIKSLNCLNWYHFDLVSLLQYLDTLLSTLCTWRIRGSDPEEFYKKGVPKISTKFTGKYLCRGLFFNKMQAEGLQLH